MRLANPFPELAIGKIFETFLPDFMLAFAFFTALTYAVLGKRFDRQRSAVVMSAVFGMSLAVGLVWWEQANDLSIRNLGPIAVGFAIIMLAGVMYRAIQRIGGTWAGFGVALGASLLVSKLFEIGWFVDADILQTVITVSLIVGILAFIMHTHSSPVFKKGLAKLDRVKFDRGELKRNRHVSKQLSDRFRTLRQEPSSFSEPAEAQQIVSQIQRMLPAEGWLTGRMAELRKKAHQLRNGHVARLEETREVFSRLPTSAKKKAAGDLARRYNQLIGIDKRLERLDKAVAAGEQRVRGLTKQACDRAEAYDFAGLAHILKQAEKLQKQNSKLLRLIGRTEKKLTAIAHHVAEEAKRVTRA